MEWLSTIAKEYGLFVALVAYVLWFHDKLLKSTRAENNKRETRYINVIDKLSESFANLEKDVAAIKTAIEKRED